MATSNLGDVHGLKTLWVLCDLELHLFPFTQGLEAVPLNLRVMHEHVLTAILRLDKTIALLVVEPLNGAFQVCHHLSFSFPGAHFQAEKV